MTESPARRVPWLRIFVEGVTIVGSILLAFAIDAWWDGRRDHSRGDVYLRMLISDARETLSNNARFGGFADDSTDWAGARLVRVYYQPELPPRDSLMRWFSRSLGFWVVQPTMGTAQAIVATGDLGLIRSVDLRSALPRYLTNMNAFEGFEQQWADDFVAASEELSHQVDITLLRPGLLTAAARDSLAVADRLFPLPAGALRPLLGIDVEALVRNADVHRILVRMNRAKERMRLNRGRMKIATEQFLRQLEAAQIAEGGPLPPSDTGRIR
jgi:hypothetical protein